METYLICPSSLSSEQGYTCWHRKLYLCYSLFLNKSQSSCSLYQVIYIGSGGILNPLCYFSQVLWTVRAPWVFNCSELLVADPFLNSRNCHELSLFFLFPFLLHNWWQKPSPPRRRIPRVKMSSFSLTRNSKRWVEGGSISLPARHLHSGWKVPALAAVAWNAYCSCRSLTTGPQRKLQ